MRSAVQRGLLAFDVMHPSQRAKPFHEKEFVALRRLIRDVVKCAGFDLRRYRPVVSDPYRAQQMLLRSSPCRTVFDVGAYQGETISRYSDLFPAAEIYGFEPFPPSYEALTAKFAANKRIHLVNAAVSSRIGEAKFHVNGIAATNSLLPRPFSGPRYFPAEAVTLEIITVPTTTIDQFRKERPVEVPQILKMDVQGAELEALRGAEETLKTGGVSLIFAEVTFVPHYEGGVLFHELSVYLAERGFTLFNLYDLHSANMGQLRFGDAIFVADRLKKAVIDQLSTG